MTATPPALLPYTVHPWVVANDRLRADGWAPTSSNEEAYVATHAAGPLATISPRRRQEIALAVTGACPRRRPWIGDGRAPAPASAPPAQAGCCAEGDLGLARLPVAHVADLHLLAGLVLSQLDRQPGHRAHRLAVHVR